MLEYRDQPGEMTYRHKLPAFVLCAVGPFRRSITSPDGKVIMRECKGGEVIYSAAQTHIGTNVGDTPTHVIIVESKQPARG